MRSIIKYGLALLILAAGALAVPLIIPAKNTQSAKDTTERKLNANAWTIYTTNYGSFIHPHNYAPGGYWGGPRFSYIYGAGLWVGALDAGGTPHVAMGYDTRTGITEMGPVDPYTYSYVDYNINRRARYYLSTNEADRAEWPLRDASGNIIIRSAQDGYGVYSDQNPVFTPVGEQPMGIRIKQWSYAWNYADNNDIVFFYFRVFNVSGHALGSVRLGPCLDADVGIPTNDLTGFDYTRNLAIQFNANPEPGWGVFGCRYFESPINNIGQTVHITDNQYPHDIAPGAPLGMTAFKIFTIDVDPVFDGDRYLMMEGYNYNTGDLDAYDELGSVTPGDKRFMMMSGPFNMAIGDSVATCCGVMCALDSAALVMTSDVAQDIYNNHFELAVPPAVPEITCIPGDKYVRISWTRKSETTPDSYYDRIDSTNRWYTYFKGSWQYCGDTLLVDSLTLRHWIDTLTAVSTVIPRGGINPYPAPGDTTMCRYSQKALYTPYDFQGYILYRARTQADLADPARREVLGGKVTNPLTNASGCCFDINDGIQIVIDLAKQFHQTPHGIDTLDVYDTLGTDRGLIYTYLDNDVINNFGHWYGIAAYDYQKNAYFTHKCPTTSSTSPASGAQFAAAMAPSADYKAASLTFATAGGADARALDGNGALDYAYDLFVGNPNAMRDTRYTIRWSVTRKPQYFNPDTVRVPFYHGRIYDASGNYLDSTGIWPNYGLLSGTDAKKSFYGSSYDQSTFGGIIFRPYLKYKPEKCKVDTAPIIMEAPGGSRTYPLDSVACVLYANTWKNTASYWMWRGSDIEIRWRDTLVRIGAATADSQTLTCTVWDVTNNVEIPFQGGLRKDAMTKPGWCFNYLPNTSDTLRYIWNRSNNANKGIFISGLTVFPNYRHMAGAAKNMVWANRPETGDVWRIHCSGPRTPVDGNSVTFVTTSPGQVANLGSSLLDKVMVVPNPYLVRAKWDVTPDYPNLYFTNLPAKCTIRIYTMAGDLVRVLEHETSYAANNSAEKWNLLTTYNKRVASGLYIYHVDAPGIGTKIGKFAVIK